MSVIANLLRDILDALGSIGGGGSDGATEAKQDVGNASLASIDTKTPALVSGSVPVYVTNQLDISTITSYLLDIKNSCADIDANTDAVESKLDSIVSAINANGAVNHADLLAVVAELQSVDANTDAQESILTNILNKLIASPATLAEQQTQTTALNNINANQTNGTQRARISDKDGNLIGSLDDGNGSKAIEVAQSATNFVLSASNSTTAQLAAGATFTGAIETIFNQQTISMLLTSDQNGTLTINQYIDAAGTRRTNQWVYSIVAGTPFSRSFTGNGNYFNVSFQNNGASATTTLNLNTAYGTLAPASNLGNMPISLDEMGGTALTLGRKTNGSSIPVVKSANRTYSATFVGAVTAAAATDVFTITGSALSTIEVLAIIVSGVQTTDGMKTFNVVKRSTANTGGTSTVQTVVPFDSSDVAANATVRAYTANPTLGTTVGVVGTAKKQIPNPNFGNADNQPYTFDFTKDGSKPIVLRGASQVCALNFNGENLTGNNMNIQVIFTEA